MMRALPNLRPKRTPTEPGQLDLAIETEESQTVEPAIGPLQTPEAEETVAPVAEPEALDEGLPFFHEDDSIEDGHHLTL